MAGSTRHGTRQLVGAGNSRDRPGETGNIGRAAGAAESVCKTLTPRVRVSPLPRSPPSRARPVHSPKPGAVQRQLGETALADAADYGGSLHGPVGKQEHPTSLLRSEFSVQLRAGPRRRGDVGFEVPPSESREVPHRSAWPGGYYGFLGPAGSSMGS